MSTATPEFPGRPAPASVANDVSSSSGKATASLILGIIGIVLIPIIAPIAAIVLGRRAKDEIAANPGMTGAGLAQAGVVLGWVSLGLFALFFVIAFAMAL